MKQLLILIIGFVAAFCLGYFIKDIVADKAVSATKNAMVKQDDNADKTKKVTGVAGIFFKCKDPDKVKEWYKTHLGFNVDKYGALFEWQEGNAPGKKGILQWATFAETDSYFNPSQKDFMINYRVENLDRLAEQLKNEGVTFTDTIATYPYGKFLHIMDIEGNKIELYQPDYTYHPSAETKSK
jgi:predicted enzyme related to lactoylglutathione lyase